MPRVKKITSLGPGLRVSQGRLRNTGGTGGGSYGDTDAQSAVGLILTDTSTIDFIFDLMGPSIAAHVKDASITEAKQVLADNTTHNVSSTKHGYAPKSPADATKFLNGAATPDYAQVKDSDLSTSDVTTNDVTSSKHGFAPKSPADATKFLNGAATPAYALVKDSDLSTSDITTNDVTTSKHGFAPKAPNDAAKFLDGTGAWSVPAGTGSAWTSIVALTASPTGVATWTITSIPNTYRVLRLLFSGISCDTATRALRIEYSTDNGSTWVANGFRGHHWNNATTTPVASSAFLADFPAQGAANTAAACIYIEDYADGNALLTARGAGFYDSGTAWSTYRVDLNRFAALNALRFSWNGSGNFDGVLGTYSLFGLL